MAGFIEDDSDSEEDDSDGNRRKKEKKKKSKGVQLTNRRATGRVEGITAEAWQEVMDVFGDGTDYKDALEIKEVEDEEKELKDVSFSSLFLMIRY